VRAKTVHCRGTITNEKCHKKMPTNAKIKHRIIHDIESADSAEEDLRKSSVAILTASAVTAAARKNAPFRTLKHLFAFILVGFLTLAFLWSYWPTLAQLVDAWNRIPDYSHGFLVVPIALMFLWMNRKKRPELEGTLAWGGLLLMSAGFAMRYFGARFYLGSVDAWSMVLWLAGTVWFLGGRALFRWSLPAIAFLLFMIPLPYGMERWLSLPLQRIATVVSCWALQCLGQPALAEGNTLWVSNHTLEVEQACSGLRIFVGIFALAYAYLLFMRRTWWEWIFLLASVIPISIVANSARIVATALLQQMVSGEAANRFAHDFSGWVMIPFAAGLFGLALWYVRSLVREEEEVDVRSIVELDRSSQ
jgi:exosortase